MIKMNDETNREVATLMFKASKLTAEALAEAMKKFLDDAKNVKEGIKDALTPDPNEPKHGKMTMEELMAQNQGAVSIEIPHDGVGDFVKVAKEHHVDFAIKKDKETDPPTYMCFFKARDTDVIQDAFKEFIRKQEQKRDGPSFHKTLEKVKEEVHKYRERTKEKKRAREEVI